MTIYSKSIKTKYIILPLLIIVFWQFTFPQPTMAMDEIEKFNNPITTKFADQWEINLMEKFNRLPINEDKPVPIAKQTMTINVTAYSSTPDQTSGNPFITASGSHVEDGVIAANFLPIGTKVRFPDYYGNKVFTVEDRMSAKYWYKADIWMETREEAKNWGVRYTTIEIL